MANIVWTDYLKYRAAVRGFDLTILEQIILHSAERYFDNETRRTVVIGKHDKELVIIPFDTVGDEVTPVTIHATTRQQIRFRIRTGRFST
jgi:hypothetical protein